MTFPKNFQDRQLSLKEDFFMKNNSKPVRPATETPVSTELEEQIRCRAYEMYAQRGNTEGYELEDWLQAEAEVLGSKREPVAA